MNYEITNGSRQGNSHEYFLLVYDRAVDMAQSSVTISDHELDTRLISGTHCVELRFI